MKTLREKVEKLKLEHGLTNQQLSLMLGYSKNRLSDILRVGVTTQMQNQIMQKLDALVFDQRNEVEILKAQLEECKAQLKQANDKLIVMSLRRKSLAKRVPATARQAVKLAFNILFGGKRVN